MWTKTMGQFVGLENKNCKQSQFLNHWQITRRLVILLVFAFAIDAFNRKLFKNV